MPESDQAASSTTLDRDRKGSHTENNYGLDTDWSAIEEVLKEVIPVYDKTNRFISFGSDLRIRKAGLSLLMRHLEASGVKSYNVLDVGAGPGRMSQLLSSLSGNGSTTKMSDSILYDALKPMMEVAMKRNSGSQGLLGVYESIPLRDHSITASIAGFAIRDSQNLLKALSEVFRVLKANGYFLIVDLAKPDSKAKSALISVYWVAMAPLMAFFAAGRLGLKFGALYSTYKRLPRKREFTDILLKTGFEVVEQNFRMLDGVCIILLRKNAG